MDDKQTYLYHCDRCGELFKSKKRSHTNILCTTCGEHPVKPKFATASAFASVTDKQPLEKSKKSTHGIPGLDEADFVSMKKQQQRKNIIAIGALWVLCLAVIALMAFNMNEKAKEAAKTDVELDEEDKSYLARKENALTKCINRFRAFTTENIIHSKSAHILNGSDLVLDINRYYKGNLIKSELTAARVASFDLIESKNQSKAIALLNYTPKSSDNTNSYVFEVIFWKVGEEWLIDWPQYIRLGDMTWFRFSESKQVGSPRRFRLYAREPSTESLGLSGYEEYKFSEPLNNSIRTTQLSKSVFVKHQTTLKSQLTKQFKELKKSKEIKTQNKSLLRSFDPPQSIRIDATFDFEEIEGETVMVLKDIHQLDWQTPPNKEN